LSNSLPLIYLARHGETEWSISGRHTGRTDLPLTAQGEQNARLLGARLAGMKFAQVATSPVQRASRTCELAGFGGEAVSDDDLMEWDYGEYEGLRTTEILVDRSDWFLFRDGCPGGESPQQVGARADRVIERIRAAEGNTILFAHGHYLRVFTARWLGLEPYAGRFFVLGTAGLSVLGYEHNRQQPVVRLWNETGHFET